MSTTALSTSKVWHRQGPRKHWNEVPDPNPAVGFHKGHHTLDFRFILPDGDGQNTEVSLTVGRDDFDELLEAMIGAGGRRSTR